LERQGAGPPGNVGLDSLVAWRPALLGTSSQDRAFRVANARPLGINVDDITRRGISIGSALLVLELLPKGKALFSFLESLRTDQQWIKVKALLLYATLKCSNHLRIYTRQ
jgi:hypothetical protein